jgi:hypothetical protein
MCVFYFCHFSESIIILLFFLILLRIAVIPVEIGVEGMLGFCCPCCGWKNDDLEMNRIVSDLIGVGCGIFFGNAAPLMLLDRQSAWCSGCTNKSCNSENISGIDTDSRELTSMTLNCFGFQLGFPNRFNNEDLKF